MDGTKAVRPNPLPIVAVIGAGAIALCAGAATGGDAAAAGGIAFFVAVLIGLGQTAYPVVTWPNALAVFIAVLWFVPIKLYRLPVDLPFQLELYRVVLMFLVLGFVIGSLTSKREIETLGAGKPLFVMALAALSSQIVNAQAIDVAGSEGQALKSLSLFLSFIVVFLIFASTLDGFREIERTVATIVLGGVIVAVAALYEGRTNFNPFDHFAEWFPGFVKNPREILELRGGRLRVHASAQHPIALGAVFMMVVPLAMFLYTTAKTQLRKGLWIASLVVVAAGAAATISRTTVVMSIAMAIAAFIVRRQALVRLLPILLVLPILVHAAAPGAIGGLVKSFGSQEGTGFVQSFYGRSGESGSGRLADVGPGLDLWLRSPIIGLGIDNPEIATTGATTVSAGTVSAATGQTADVSLIFDDQYLHTLVTLGLVGLVGIVWFVWGAVVKLGRASRLARGYRGDFLAACSVSCAGYGAGMFLFDSIAFIQVTLLLFITAAIGLKAITLPDEPGATLGPVTATQ